jgi:hypothetical protein
VINRVNVDTPQRRVRTGLTIGQGTLMVRGVRSTIRADNLKNTLSIEIGGQPNNGRVVEAVQHEVGELGW